MYTGAKQTMFRLEKKPKGFIESRKFEAKTGHGREDFFKIKVKTKRGRVRKAWRDAHAQAVNSCMVVKRNTTLK